MLADGELRHGQRRREPRPLLGAARRRRQLRRRHVVPVPAAPGRHRATPARCSGRWSGRRRSCAGTATSSPSAPDELNGFFALHDRAARPALPGGAARQEDVRRSSGATPARGQGRRRSSSRSQRSSARRRSDVVGPMPLPALQSTVRRALPAGPPVVLAGGLRQRDPRRGDRRARSNSPPRMPTPQSTMHLYPIDGAAHASAAATRRGLPRRASGRRSSSASTRTRPTRDAITRWTQGLLGGAAPLLGRRRLRELHDGRGPGAGAGHLPRATTTGWPRSRRSTTRTTCSA